MKATGGEIAQWQGVGYQHGNRQSVNGVVDNMVKDGHGKIKYGVKIKQHEIIWRISAAANVSA